MNDHLLADSTLRLTDGSDYGVILSGKAQGFPVFYCHGSGSSRLESLILSEAAYRKEVLLIGIDRPGIGKSTWKSDFQILQWPKVISEIAKQFAYREFSVLGVSAGGPFALACAYRLPAQLWACGLVSTVSPAELLAKKGSVLLKITYWLSRKQPRLFNRYLEMTVKDSLKETVSDPGYLFKYGLLLCRKDRELLADPKIGRLLSKAMAESYRQSANAGKQTAALLSNDWGFAPSEVDFSKIYFWHGKKDRIMPIKAAEVFAKQLPQAEISTDATGGHFSVLAENTDIILQKLTKKQTEPG